MSQKSFSEYSYKTKFRFNNTMGRILFALMPLYCTLAPGSEPSPLHFITSAFAATTGLMKTLAGFTWCN